VPCMYSTHHEPESADIVVIIVFNVCIGIVYSPRCLLAGTQEEGGFDIAAMEVRASQTNNNIINNTKIVSSIDSIGNLYYDFFCY